MLSWLEAEVDSPSYVDTSIAPHLIKDVKENIMQGIHRYFQQAKDLLKMYEGKYGSLLNGEYDNLIAQYLLEEHTFTEHKEVCWTVR